MSHNPPPPTPKRLHRRGNNDSGYVQASPSLHQAFIEADAVQPSSNPNKSSSDSSSRTREAVDRHGSQKKLRAQPNIQLPTPWSSPEQSVPRDPRDFPQLSTMNVRTALVDQSTKPVSKKSHPACLTPGQRVTSRDAEQAHQKEQQGDHFSESFATSARTSDADCPTLELGARQLFQQAIPPGFKTNTDFGGFGSDSQDLTAIVLSFRCSRAIAAQQYPRRGPTSEDYPSVPSIQGIGSRYPAEAKPFSTIIRADYRADTAQDEGLGTLTAEKDTAMWGEAALRGDGYRVHDTQHHPDISGKRSPAIPAASTTADVSASTLHSRRQTQRSKELRPQAPFPSHHSSFSSTETSASFSPSPTGHQPSSIALTTETSASSISSSSSVFSPPSPPPRVSCDIVARHPFLAASRFYFEVENVGCGDIDGSEESATLGLEGEAEAGARRLSGLMLEWREWTWGFLVRMEEGWSINFEEKLGASIEKGKGREGIW